MGTAKRFGECVDRLSTASDDEVVVVEFPDDGIEYSETVLSALCKSGAKRVLISPVGKSVLHVESALYSWLLRHHDFMPTYNVSLSGACVEFKDRGYRRPKREASVHKNVWHEKAEIAKRIESLVRAGELRSREWVISNGSASIASPFID